LDVRILEHRELIGNAEAYMANPTSLKILPVAAVCAIIAIAVAVCASAAPAAKKEAPSWKYMDKQALARLLEKGEIASVDVVGPEKLELCSIGILAKAPPEKVWRAITEFDDYEKMMPDMSAAKVLERSGNTALVEFTVTVLKVSMLTISTDYVLKYTFDAPRRADISWVSGKVKNVSGYWELYPVNGGKNTVVIYSITSDLASASPLVGAALQEQPATVMSINLSSAIVLSRVVVDKAEKL